MGSTFGGIEITKRALFAQQTAQQTTGHNIANANTRGYTRQVVNFVASRPMEAPGMMRSNTPGQLGQGVEFDHINRVREQFLDSQFYNENKNLGEWSIRQNTLDKLETIVNEPSNTGIRTVLQNFWSSWSDLSKDPDNLTARAVVKENALALTDAFNHVSKQLSDLSSDLTNNINVKVTEVATTVEQLASLNREIFRVEGLGNNANDLRDQRDLLVDDLSKVVNISVTETTAGYTVRMGNQELVNGVTFTPVTNADFFANAKASGDLNSGEINGMMISRDETVKSFQAQLDNMVRSVAEGEVKVTLPAGTMVPNGSVDGLGNTIPRPLPEDTEITVKGLNGLHQLGYNLNGTLEKGEPFFTIKPGATELNAASIVLNPNIANNVAKIAASMRSSVVNGTETVVRGNNDLALIFAGLKNLDFNFDPGNVGESVLKNGTIDEFFQSFVSAIGVQSNEANRQLTNQKVLVDQVDARRQSISGVSLDEEMANMLKFQHAYNAAARALTSFDEMLDKVINGMGMVGR